MNAMFDINTLVEEIDYGTPASKSEKAVTLTIDGQAVTVPEGTSIMRAAMDAGVEIPKLCATDMLDAFGSCRVCLVEIEGRGGTPASCTTPVAEGIVVKTQTERLDKIRRGVMELYISDHPLGWDTDAGLRGSEFDTVAKSIGLTENRYGVDGRNHVAPGNGSLNIDYIARDESNPYFTYDASQCIVCSRCVRACEEVQGTYALTITGRGFESRVAAGMSENFIESECVSCGACVQACPTDALREKSVLQMGRPTHSVVTTCAYCGVGCSFKAEMRGDEVVRMVPYKDGKANRGHSCVKGRFAWGYASHKDRILNPMIREKISDPWREVSWDEAFSYVAKEFRRIQFQYGRGAVGGITSSRCTNEETYLVQKLVRQGFANNNVDTCARVCHSPTGYGLKTTLRHLGRHPGFQFGRLYRRGNDHRRQPDRWTSGLRLAAEKAAAPGRKADRGRPAPHRYRAFGTCRGATSPAIEAGHERRGGHLTLACHRNRRALRRGIHPRALRLVGVRGLGGLRRRAAAQPGRG